MSDTQYTDEPVCPECGIDRGDAWEWAEDECGEYECDCGETIEYVKHISITYTTNKKEVK